jgi:hypothetical protein
LDEEMHSHGSRINGLLFELCVAYGWDQIDGEKYGFGALELIETLESMKMDPSDREAVLEAIMRAEFPDEPAGGGLHPRRLRAEGPARGPDAGPKTAPKWLRDLVDDWLFDPHGRGARSGLPMTD